MDKKKVNKIVEEIHKSKKFSRLDKDYLADFVVDFFKKEDSKHARKLIEEKDYENFKKNKVYKKSVKSIKTHLHDNFGVFQLKDVGKKDKIFGLMKKTKDEKKLLDLHYEMLHTHSSTRERRQDYSEVYRNIFNIVDKNKKILDVGCGMNAFSLPFIEFDDFDYQGFDFVDKDLKLINDYFKEFNIKGNANFLNVFDKLPNITADVCFLFKMTDVLDYGRNDHKKTEEFIKKIKTKWIVVSFPTKTVSNKKMNNPRRSWFEMMLKRLNYEFDYFEIKNECFYVVKK